MCICYYDFSSRYVKDFSDEVAGDTDKCDVLMFYNEMYQHLEDFQNLVTQYFPNDQYILQILQ